jgi:hypothetical protein
MKRKPIRIANELDFEERDCLIWRYYDKAKMAVVYKRAGLISRDKIKHKTDTIN